MAWKEWQLEILKTEGPELTLYQIADKVGKDAPVVRRYMDRHKLPYQLVRNGNTQYSDEKIREIESLLEKGELSHKAIGELIGVSKSFVHRVANGSVNTDHRKKGTETKHKTISEDAASAFKAVFG
ncbi:hypothetical protein [Vibrio phage CKB-S2]|nr:hypothetical protein [Vibrio phage CKB-S2]